MEDVILSKIVLRILTRDQRPVIRYYLRQLPFHYPPLCGQNLLAKLRVERKQILSILLFELSNM